jgi:hypothetical protein
MPTEITTTTLAYKFEELSDKAKDKVREWFSPDIDLSYVIDDYKGTGHALGYNVDDVQWRVSYSQGDGASWTGTIHLPSFAERIPASDPNFAAYQILIELMREGWVNETAAIVRSSYFYNHSGTMGVESITSEGFFDEQSTIHEGIMQGARVCDLFDVVDEDFLETVQVDILDAAKDFADKIYRALVEAYEWETGDEHIAECAEINEWLFDENGKII